MKNSPVFLTMDQVLRMHTRMIEVHGGDSGIRDMSLLESAVYGPQSSFGGEYLYGGVPDMASAYLYGICKNHALVDGNKRTALGAAGQFIACNDHYWDVTSNELVGLTEGVADDSVSQEEATEFFRKTVTPKLEVQKPKVLFEDSACGDAGFVIGNKIRSPKNR
ncbi:MAG: type II toxin-antitoxin system death-on-curing family toxin [Alphaproteobacteria bacterium]|nr:type II toxin-antitoxin system death-on-curing family toxin [Alphaproteobacteria bacterium]